MMTSAQRQQMDAYVDLVLRFRKALNLTSISNKDAFYTKFIQPSAAMVEFMPESGRMLDIGSGMGIPGIPLLILKPGLTGVLVERRKKRAEFLRHVVRQLGLQSEVYDVGVEDIEHLAVDVCVARAVTRVTTLLDMCTPHVSLAAKAVFPVPMPEVEVKVDGWFFEASVVVDAGEHQQRIQTYQWEGVSRET